IIGAVAAAFGAPEALDHPTRNALRAEHQSQGRGVALAVSLLGVLQKIDRRVQRRILAAEVQRVGVFSGSGQVIAEGTGYLLPAAGPHAVRSTLRHWRGDADLFQILRPEFMGLPGNQALEKSIGPLFQS